MLVTGRIKIKCVVCGTERTEESTPYKAFKEYGTFPNYRIENCEKCKTWHAHEIKAEIKED